MKKVSGKLVTALLATSFVVPSFATLIDQQSYQDIAQMLGWTPDAKANICHGYYKEPMIVLKYPNPGAVEKTATTITAQKKVTYAEHGDATLRGHVVIKQPGREIVADQVVLRRNKKSGKIIIADLTGHVHLREFGKILVGEHAQIDFVTNKITLNHVVYRLSTHSPTGDVNVWGRATKAVRDHKKNLTLFHALYSTCQPADPSWYIRSSKLYLNRSDGYGSVHNAAIFWHGIPSFYLPYMRFPIGNRRKKWAIDPGVRLFA